MPGDEFQSVAKNNISLALVMICGRLFSDDVKVKVFQLVMI